MNKDSYHSILVHHAMPSVNRIFNDNQLWIFMHDNNPKHTSGKVKDYLQSKAAKKRSKIKLMDWPSQSPNLNPLELLWEECDREMKKRKPTNLASLETVVREVWTTMPTQKMHKLIARLPALCKETIKANGAYFIEKSVGHHNKR